MLQRACGDGRLTLEEFSVRVGAVWAAEDDAALQQATAGLATTPIVGSADVEVVALVQLLQLSVVDLMLPSVAVLVHTVTFVNTVPSSLSSIACASVPEVSCVQFAATWTPLSRT